MKTIICIQARLHYWVSFFSLDTGYPGWGFS